MWPTICASRVIELGSRPGVGRSRVDDVLRALRSELNPEPIFRRHSGCERGPTTLISCDFVFPGQWLTSTSSLPIASWACGRPTYRPGRSSSIEDESPAENTGLCSGHFVVETPWSLRSPTERPTGCATFWRPGAHRSSGSDARRSYAIPESSPRMKRTVSRSVLAGPHESSARRWRVTSLLTTFSMILLISTPNRGVQLEGSRKSGGGWWLGVFHEVDGRVRFGHPYGLPPLRMSRPQPVGNVRPLRCQVGRLAGIRGKIH